VPDLSGRIVRHGRHPAAGREAAEALPLVRHHDRDPINPARYAAIPKITWPTGS